MRLYSLTSLGRTEISESRWIKVDLLLSKILEYSDALWVDLFTIDACSWINPEGRCLSEVWSLSLKHYTERKIQNDFEWQHVQLRYVLRVRRQCDIFLWPATFVINISVTHFEDNQSRMITCPRIHPETMTYLNNWRMVFVKRIFFKLFELVRPLLQSNIWNMEVKLIIKNKLIL